MITKFNKIHLLHFAQAFLMAVLTAIPLSFFVFDSFSDFIHHVNEKTILFLSYIVYIFIIFIVFIKLTYWIRQRRFHRLNVFKRLQYDFLQKQLDSHFTFNVLNSVSAAILNDNKHEAYHQLTIFAKVLRYTYNNKTKLFHQLDNEIELLNNYLILEKHRFKEKFEYELNIDPGVDLLTEIPKQMIQIHVDNAIKHGLMPLKSGGMVKVEINKEEDDYLHISVEDNGIGRQKANQLNLQMRKNHSIKTMKNLITYFNSLKTEGEISMRIYDLYTNGKASGTKVAINLPSGLRFRH
jgi:LytS/YehU family sensor histidine kinase